jgi:hypothetical protein
MVGFALAAAVVDKCSTFHDLLAGGSSVAYLVYFYRITLPSVMPTAAQFN